MAASCVEEVVEGIAEILGVDPGKIRLLRADGRTRPFHEVILTEAQARRLAVLARKGKEQGWSPTPP